MRWTLPHWSEVSGSSVLSMWGLPAVLQFDDLKLGGVLHGCWRSGGCDGRRSCPATVTPAPGFFSKPAPISACRTCTHRSRATRTHMLQGRVRAAGDGHAVMLRAAPHEVEDIADPREVQRVGQPEAEVLEYQASIFFGSGEPARHGRYGPGVLPHLDLAVRAHRHAGQTSIVRPSRSKNGKPYPPPGVWRYRFADQGDPGAAEPLGEAVDGCAVRPPNGTGRSACLAFRTPTMYCSGDPSAAK